MVPDTHKLITDLITLEPYNSVYSRVTVDKVEMERIARNKNHDEVYETFRELCQTLLNPHWDSFVDTEKFKKLKSGKQKTSIGSLGSAAFSSGRLCVYNNGLGQFQRFDGLSILECNRSRFPGEQSSGAVFAVSRTRKWSFDHDKVCG
jgi:hypothetical protein